MPIHIAIVQSDEAILVELQQLIDRTGELCCVFASTSGEDALEAIPHKQPQVVIMELELPDICGIECTWLLRRALRGAHVLIYSSRNTATSVSRAFQAGAAGYILKQRDHQEIIQAVWEIVRGGAPMTAEVERTLIHSLRQEDTGDQQYLFSPREHEILDCLKRGLVNKEIGDRLCISTNTVRYHLKKIYTKLGVHTRTEAVLKHLFVPWPDTPGTRFSGDSERNGDPRRESAASFAVGGK